MHVCPVCLRKLCWSLQREPVPYLGRLEAFCRRYRFSAEAGWYDKTMARLASSERIP
jgi:hypothetical protein